MRDVLRGNHAARAGLVLDNERAAERFLQGRPDDPGGQIGHAARGE